MHFLVFYLHRDACNHLCPLLAPLLPASQRAALSLGLPPALDGLRRLSDGVLHHLKKREREK